MNRKKISITASCYNEEGNIEELYRRCRNVLAKHPQYDYEFILEDNCSTDRTREILRGIAAKDKHFKVILNSRNFGHIRSPFNAFLSGTGDAVVTMCSDLQEPPELIDDFIQAWEKGSKVVVGIRSGTRASWTLELLRKAYYTLLSKAAEGGRLIPSFTGFELYDRAFVNALKQYNEPYPYFRGLVSEVGFQRTEIPFVQEKRMQGITKNNFFTLYDMAVTGFVNHTKLPLRLAVFTGFLLAAGSLVIALIYLILKLIRWDTFELGLAPIMIGLFFFAAVQLICIGIIGEYIGAIWTQVKNKPLVIEEERINFDEQPPNS